VSSTSNGLVYYSIQCNTANQLFGIEGKSAANEVNLVSNELSNIVNFS